MKMKSNYPQSGSINEKPAQFLPTPFILKLVLLYISVKNNSQLQIYGHKLS
jgi:hypothetical protein